MKMKDLQNVKNVQGNVTRAYFKCTYPKCMAKKYVISYTELLDDGTTAHRSSEQQVETHNHPMQITMQ